MIYICTPSRGLIFSRTVQSIIEGMQALNAVGLPTKYLYTHDLPIPECFNNLTEKAMGDPACDRIVFIEEDMYLDPEAFVALATADNPVTTLQYNDKNGSPHGIVHYNTLAQIIWCGLGATSIKKEVFDAIKGTNLPYFRTDVRYKITGKRPEGDQLAEEYEEIEKPQVWDDTKNGFVDGEFQNTYGGQDVDFFTRTRKLGFEITMLKDFRAHHFQLISLGEPHTNQGVHNITNV